MNQTKAIPNKQVTASLKARARAKEIYAELTRAEGHTPFDRTVADCLAKEGYKRYTPAMISKWRRADNWSESGPDPRLPPVLLAYHPGDDLSLQDVRVAAAGGVRLHYLLVEIVERRLKGLNPAELSIADTFRAMELLSKNLESVESLRVRLSAQQIAEAQDVTKSGDHTNDHSDPEKKLSDALDQLRARLNGGH